jgi:hypothetical protein
VAVVVVVLLGIGAIAFLGHGKSSSTATTPSPSPTKTTQSSPSPSTKSLLALPAELKASATAPVTSVQICSPLSQCTIFGTAPDTDTVCDGTTSCKVDVAIYFSAAQSAGIAYTFKFFDACSGQTTDLPGPAIGPLTFYKPAIPHPGFLVTLPAGVKAGYLVAILTSPGAGISDPFAVGGSSCS